MEVEMKIRGLMMDPVTNMPIVILRDADNQRVLPIWVGPVEANAIALQIENVAPPRPMTHDLLKNLLIECGAPARPSWWTRDRAMPSRCRCGRARQFL